MSLFHEELSVVAQYLESIPPDLVHKGDLQAALINLCRRVDAIERLVYEIETNHIKLTKAEIQSGMSRVKWAENLILQLPEDHDGRNSWLLNYGVGVEAVAIRLKHGR